MRQWEAPVSRIKRRLPVELVSPVLPVTSKFLPGIRYEPAKPANRLSAVAVHFYALISALCVLSSPTAMAAAYYVDNAVGVSGNGQSWTAAWKVLSNATGLLPGDTVYIS